ncbi:chromosome segregation ATPase [Calothrix rhizosoleniae]|uniref:chromosome segregation ATPase n=1 Tax=Calothrix rhizosoleniae TaxID=888997 RepID=UPI001F174AE6|nr:chromosome segregation ATPase [Calothrix rhizosoleniae]
MAERDIPESWSLDKTEQPGIMARLSRIGKTGDTHHSQVSATSSHANPVNRTTDKHFGINDHSDNTVPSSQVSGNKLRKLPRWARSWVLWTVILALAPGSIAFLAMSMLLKLPSAPNCPSIFWPLASASVRLHCAQLAASKQNVKDLLQAISLVKHLPQSHPLRGEIDRLIEGWSRDILDLSDVRFQDGKLEEAIATARQIPRDLAAYKLVDEKIAGWRSTWSKAEKLYTTSEEHIREQRWYQAFLVAAKLLRVDNKYWATTKYNQLNQLITQTREDGNKLAQAKSLAKSSKVKNLVKAIELAESIGKKSYIYSKAQEIIPEIGQTMLDLAQSELDKKNGDEAIAIAQEIPDITGLTETKDDFIALAEAKNSAWLGTIYGLEVAISQAQQIDASRPVYDQAQQLIARWQLEIEDVSRLDQARLLASQGTIGDLNAAISQAQLVPANNPRSREAKQEIRRWVGEIQTIEDRPYLERADQIALLGDINSLQAAIAEARQIRRGRALYRDARKKISRWRYQVQRIQDRPVLDQARTLADRGNLNGAIAAASQISRGRALSRDARRDINRWQSEINAKQNWKRAKEVALQGTPNALARAMRLARRIPRTNALRIDANIAMDQWSRQLLDIARSQGVSDMIRGIRTAKMIPRGTAAYSAAREQIRTWQNFLKPIPQEVERVTSPTPKVENTTAPEPSPATPTPTPTAASTPTPTPTLTPDPTTSD